MSAKGIIFAFFKVRYPVVMKIHRYTVYLDILERLCIFREAKERNQINSQHTISH
jgi:hypothetical protein